MATPTSDYDYRGIVIAPMECYLGFMNKFEQAVDTDKGKHVYTHFPVGFLQDDPRLPGNNPDIAPDMQVMELTKFVNLALSNNPSVLETLFVDDSDRLILHPIMRTLMDNREKILSKQAKARFCGYAISQLKRIKTHRKYLLNPIETKPLRKDFGLPEHSLLSADQIGAADALIQKELDEFMVDQTHLPEDVKIELSSSLGKSMRAIWTALHIDTPYPVGDDKKFSSTEEALFWGAARDQEFSENFLQVLVQEKRYRTAKREYDQYQYWKAHRNPARAEIERKYHVDLKHATHLIRLLTTCREILEKGTLTVKRPDAEFLLSIRNGAWSYEQIVEFAEREDVALNEVVKNCSLPKIPDMNFFDGIVREMILEFNQYRKD